MDADDVEPAVSVKTLPMFLKFKDIMSCYKPHFATYEKFATIDLSGDISRGIFSVVKKEKVTSPKDNKKITKNFGTANVATITIKI